MGQQGISYYEQQQYSVVYWVINNPLYRMSEETLLLRCRQTIEILNETILGHKKEIERLEGKNRSLASELQANQSMRLKSAEEVSSLKRQAVQEKAQKLHELQRLEALLIQANGEIDTKTFRNITLEQKLIDQEKQIHQLKEMARRKEEGFEYQSKEQNRRMSNLEKNNSTIFEERDRLVEQSQIYKREVAQLKLECESLNAELQQSRSIQLKTANDLQKEVSNYQMKHNQYFKIISILEEEKLECLRIVEKQRITIEDYKEMVDRVQYHNRSLKTEVDEKEKENSIIGRREHEVSAKKKGKMFEKLMQIELGVRRMMQEIDYRA